jgi:hypothetical protein
MIYSPPGIANRISELLHEESCERQAPPLARRKETDP